MRHNTARQSRDNRTITVDVPHAATSLQRLRDSQAWVDCVLACLRSLGVAAATRVIGFPGASEKFCTLACPTPGSEGTPGSAMLVSLQRYVIAAARLPRAT